MTVIEFLDMGLDVGIVEIFNLNTCNQLYKGNIDELPDEYKAIPVESWDIGISKVFLAGLENHICLNVYF